MKKIITFVIGILFRASSVVDVFAIKPIRRVIRLPNGENITIDGGMSKLMIYHNDYGWHYQP